MNNRSKNVKNNDDGPHSSKTVGNQEHYQMSPIEDARDDEYLDDAGIEVKEKGDKSYELIYIFRMSILLK